MTSELVETATPAELLAGRALDDGWRVVERLERPPDATGGRFSVGYVVESSNGKKAFLKALDFSRLLIEAQDPLAAMAAMAAAHDHERRLLHICREKRLSRVATPVGEGIVTVDARVPGGRVNYFIFDLAEGDARRHLTGSSPKDTAWKLRSLHHVAIALDQLHRHDTAHQDVKPSNVLDFGDSGTKLADLGRASQFDSSAPHDKLDVPGDLAYAPPELLYREIAPDWVRRRYGCDAYLLGGLIVCFFANVSITAWTQQILDVSQRWYRWGDTYRSALPYVRNAFDQRFIEFRDDVAKTSIDLADSLVMIVRQLCEPDPLLRGDPRNRGSVVSQYSLTRYISYLNRLARAAELKML